MLKEAGVVWDNFESSTRHILFYSKHVFNKKYIGDQTINDMKIWIRYSKLIEDRAIGALSNLMIFDESTLGKKSKTQAINILFFTDIVNITGDEKENNERYKYQDDNAMMGDDKEYSNDEDEFNDKGKE
eukprot:7135469-Ditylum_brightwellii.AAC.1